MASIENCQQIVRLVMMVMTYSASVLVNVEVGNMKEMLFSTWCNSGMASQAVTMLRNGFSSCYNGTFGHSTVFVNFSLYQNSCI